MGVRSSRGFLYPHMLSTVDTTSKARKADYKALITELEYRHAGDCRRPCLIFLVDEDSPWPPNSMDSRTGEGERGARIEALRAE